MKTIILAGAAMVAISGLAPALAQTAPGAQAQPHRMHGQMHDKVATRAEVQSKVAEHFARLDSNRDGFITREEAAAARGAMHEKIKEKVAARGGEGMDRGAAFDRLDANKDGVISREEFAAAPVRREVRIMRRGPGDEGGMHGMHGMRGMHMMHGKMFEMADANKDGRVSLQEAQAAALSHFDRADANRDGQVTPEERRQARQKMRAQRPTG